MYLSVYTEHRAYICVYKQSTKAKPSTLLNMSPRDRNKKTIR